VRVTDAPRAQDLTPHGREVRDGSRAGAKALTRGGSGPYHGGMSLGPQSGSIRNAGAGLLLAVCLVGCDDAAKRPVQAHAPAPNPAATQGAPVAGSQGQRAQVSTPQTGPGAVGNLPLRNLKAQPLISLTPRMPGGIPYLIERVK